MAACYSAATDQSYVRLHWSTSERECDVARTHFEKSGQHSVDGSVDEMAVHVVSAKQDSRFLAYVVQSFDAEHNAHAKHVEDWPRRSAEETDLRQA